MANASVRCRSHQSDSIKERAATDSDDVRMTIDVVVIQMLLHLLHKM